jgi:hypothetical protein
VQQPRRDVDELHDAGADHGSGRDDHRRLEFHQRLFVVRHFIQQLVD